MCRYSWLPYTVGLMAIAAMAAVAWGDQPSSAAGRPAPVSGLAALDVPVVPVDDEGEEEEHEEQENSDGGGVYWPGGGVTWGGGPGYGEGYAYGPGWGYGPNYGAYPGYYGPGYSPGYTSPEPFYWGGDEGEEEEHEGDEDHGDPPAGKEHGDPPAGKEHYGFLGVTVGPVLPALADQLNLADGRGVVVLSVKPDSPADKAGLQRSDVITQVNNQIVYSIMQFMKLITAAKPGESVKLSIVRQAKPQTITVTLGSTAHEAWKPRGLLRWWHHRMGMEMESREGMWHGMKEHGRPCPPKGKPHGPATAPSGKD